jgi:uncharacterized protein (UPF0333 family)
MKSDTTTLVLNFVLAVLVILGVLFAYLSMTRTRDLRALSTAAATANNALMKAQSLANDTAAYNATAKDAKLAAILTTIQPKPAH